MGFVNSQKLMGSECKLAGLVLALTPEILTVPQTRRYVVRQQVVIGRNCTGCRIHLQWAAFLQCTIAVLQMWGEFCNAIHAYSVTT